MVNHHGCHQHAPGRLGLPHLRLQEERPAGGPEEERQTLQHSPSDDH